MKAGSAADRLRDYSIDSRVIMVSLLAAVLGAVSSLLAWALIEMIGLATNLFYYQRFAFSEVEPSHHHMGWWVVFMPILGGLIVGLIARYGTPRVRGHGMPEAVEVIVFNGGRVQPRVAILKPIATAISIGSGGPFGAEGPVIITGGAVGSVLGQLLPVTDAERTVLMVSGAAAGMAAAFSCPMSATLLAVELFLFEWRPRSLVPVAIACVTAGAVRRLLLGANPIFLMQPTTVPMHHAAMLGALVVGLVAALVCTALSKAIHYAEHWFADLPIHWMWWPALGGIVVGLGGLVFPQSLGVGYDVIREILTGNVGWKLLAGVLIVKSAIWVVALGSETAGGILAPLLMIGGAMGLALGHLLTPISPGAWAVVGMTAILASALGAPLTASMLAVELTHNGGLMLPVLLACVTAYAISVLIQPRSMLTEGLSNKGLHLSREYGVDPLETVMVREVMHTSVFAMPENATRKDAVDWLERMNHRGAEAWSHWQHIFPLVDEENHLKTILTRSQMISSAQSNDPTRPLIGDGIIDPTSVGPWETLRTAAEMMANLKLRSFPVLDDDGILLGILNIEDLLEARGKQSLRDSERNRVLRLRWPFGRDSESSETSSVGDLVDSAFEKAALRDGFSGTTVEADGEKREEQIEGVRSGSD
ncbi:MAG: chloride channel protein [Edaphobacter sp.]|uniref:chloride channel protein n=1 Tax=Edaphobacter sp. TaxID=1934404 RepID=UPI0023A1685F|nr:chloride channel protein [Edaphobacter sp.]MDE1176093.1 chloride channel protein [Edaphobacter sp.]